LINDQDEFNIQPKIDDDQMMGRMNDDEPITKKRNKAPGKVGKPINATIDWEVYTRNFEAIPRENLLNTIADLLLQLKPAVPADTIKNFSDSSGRENFIKSVTLQFMSIPEYQMC
jgi:hypothetical protein